MHTVESPSGLLDLGSPVDSFVATARIFRAAASVVARLGLDGSCPTVDEAGLTQLLREARAVEADLVAVIARIGVLADQLAEAGQSAPAAELLLDQGQVRASTARAEAARSEVIEWAPGLARAVADGGVGADQLDSLARHTRSLGDVDRARLPVDELIADAQRLPADTFDTSVRRAVNRLDARLAGAAAEEKRAASSLRYWFDDEIGMGRIAGQLDPERYEVFASAIDEHTARLAADAAQATRRDANLAAAALIDLIGSPSAAGGSGHDARARGRSRTQITVVVDAKTLAAARAGIDGWHEPARTGNGHDLTDAALVRLCCDAGLRRVVLDHRNVPIDVGRVHRTATDGQWAALRALHSTCGWPGCRRPISHCQIHHITPWADGGATDLMNLIPLCSDHHHRVHDGGWTLQMTSDRDVTVARPDEPP
ncbi:MAG: HNH endonuclease [Actinomycetota bacterium]